MIEFKKAILERNEEDLIDHLWAFDLQRKRTGFTPSLLPKLLKKILTQNWNDSYILFESLDLLDEITPNFGDFKYTILDMVVDFDQNLMIDYDENIELDDNHENYSDYWKQHMSYMTCSFASRKLVIHWDEFDVSDLPLLETKFRQTSHDYALLDLAALISLYSDDKSYFEYLKKEASSEEAIDDYIEYANECIKLALEDD